jgi:DNA-binding Lrp family transcriptional regulator
MERVMLDEAAIRVLEALQSNSELSVAELAEATGMSASPAWRRVADLKARGIIKRCVAIVDPLALGLAVNVFVHVTLERQTKKALEVFEAAIKNRPEVMECYLMTGESDYLVRVVVEDLIKYQSLMVDFLTRIPGVASIRSSFTLSQVKYTTALPTRHLKS